MRFLTFVRRALLLALIGGIVLSTSGKAYGQPSDVVEAPRVLASVPAQRELVSPNANIQITFSQPMNRASVEAAFATNPPINGAFQWTDDQSVTFMPGAPLTRGTEYTVSISTEALSQANVGLEDRFRLTFQVTPNLTVNQVIPAPGAEGVEASAVITVVFDRPVVPLINTADQSSLPQPLTLIPEVAGTGEWIGTSIYQFRPETTFAGGTLYTVTISESLKDIDGSPLNAPYVWQFRTLPPQILSTSPSVNESGVLLEREITVSFNQPMDQASLREAFTLRNLNNAANVAGSFTFSADGTTLTFKPSSRLEVDTAYQFTISAAARSASGEAVLVNPQTINFRTVPFPRLLETNPTNGEMNVRPGRGIWFRFSAPMNAETFKERVTVEPKADRLTISPSYDTLYVNFQALPETTYTVTIAAGVQDLYGNTIDTPIVVRFTTGSIPPQLRLPPIYGVALTNAYQPDTQITISTMNVQEIEGKLAPLSLPQFLGLSGDANYLDLRNYTPPSFSRTWIQRIEGERNRFVTSQLKLAGDAGGQLTPGVYFLELWSPQFARFLQPPTQEPTKQIMVVATANLTLKQTPSALYVWATDLKSGAAIPNAQITAYSNGSNIANGVTDANGWVKLPVGIGVNSRGIYVTLTGDGAFGLANTYWRDYRFDSGEGIFQDFSVQKLATYLYTDQPIYRPGRPVYFRGVVRNQNDVAFTTPQGEPLLVQIYDPNGREILNKQFTLNNNGAFSDKLDLPQDAALGNYSINTLFRGEYRSINFQVAEFRPPEFLTTVTSDLPRYADGDPITFTIDGKFLFGGPVSGATVNWTVTSQPQFFFPYPLPFVFFDEGFGYPYRETRVVAQGSGKLDAQGRLQVTVSADLGDDKFLQNFLLEASVTDVSNQTVAGRTEVAVFPSTVLVGVKTDRYVGSEGVPQNLEIVTTDWDANAVGNQSVLLTISEVRWEQDPTTLNWSQKREKVVEETITTDASGKATYSFTPSRGGVYEVRVETRDPRERIASSTLSIWVAGKNYVRWQRDDFRLTLIADRKTPYQVGETASVLIASPFEEPVKALITVERADIIRTEWVEITGSYTFNLPIEEFFAPNVYVSAMIVRGGDSTKIVPEVRQGTLNLDVEVTKKLKVTLTPSSQRAEPGQEVRFDVLTTDLDGKPISAEVGLHLSDVATLSVGTPNSGPIFDAFWGQRGLSVLTTASLLRLIDAFKPTESLDDSLERSRSSGALGGELQAAPTMLAMSPPAAGESEEAGAGRDQVAQAPAVRTNFVDTPLWKPDLVTDSDGKGSISVSLPDNLTTWRLDARAISPEVYVGDSTIEIMSTKPLLVRPATPRFFVVGDEVELAVVVNNNTSSDLTAQVRLEAQGVTLRAEATQEVTIKRDDRVRVVWLATVNDVESVDLIFSAVSGEYGDASKPAVGIGDDRLLPVYKYLAPDYVSTAGVLRQPGSRTEGIIVPSEALAPRGELTVNLSPSLAAVTLDGLKALRNYPYQCIEQTVSRFLPNVVTYRALQRLNLADEKLRAELDAAVKFALDKLKREQKPDGGWGWYFTEPSNTLTTAYALLGLIEARDADLQVDNDMIARATAYLLAQPYIANLTLAEYELNRMAFVLYVLARAGNPNILVMDSLYALREKMSLEARAFLALGYGISRNALGFQDKIDAILSDLNNAAIVSATGTHWEETARDWWNWGSNTRSTSIILSTYVYFQPQSELIPNIVRWLMVARRGDAWETTQESAWALMALTAYMEATGELKANYQYAVSLNDKGVFEGGANTDSIKETKTLNLNVTDMLREQINRLTFNHGEGEGSLYYTATLHVDQPVEAIQPIDRGFKLSRTYFIDGKPVTEAKVNDVITVVLEITLSSDQYYVVINDPLPAGTEAIDRSLQTTTQVGQRPELRPEEIRFRGWGWWWFSQTELRTEKVVLSASYLPKGSYRYVYQVQATTPGVYKVIPSNGFAFYFPEVFGRSNGSLFTVK
ncbi:MAG: hypothetical protein OHK0023_28040 [Anaerolineae bacterium]